MTGTAGLPLADVDNGAGKLRITYVRRSNTLSRGIYYYVEFGNSLDPASWQVGTNESITPIDSTFERVTVTDTAVDKSRFARVRVTSL